jgi:cysteine synthase
MDQNMLSRIGNTPLVRLNKVVGDIEAEVVVKAEYLNPSGSIKDRIALRMIEDAERSGRLRPGMKIVEASTGNTATALAFVGAVKGYHVHLFVPHLAASEERLRILKSYGAEVTPVDISGTGDDKSRGGLHGLVVEKLPRIMCWELEQSSSDVWWSRQFSSPGNSGAHADGTARELLEQAGGKVDAFVAAIGTGGTLVGASRTLREANPVVEIVAVEPRTSPVIKDGKVTVPIIPGIGPGLVDEMVEQKCYDRIVTVDQGEAIEMAHRLCEEEGLFCGLSSGANVLVALQVARQLKRGQRVATVLVDSRDRYLFTEKLTT